MYALATQSTKKCAASALSLLPRSVQQANWGDYKPRNATTSETVLALPLADDRPSLHLASPRPSHLHIIKFFTGTGKGVVRERKESGGWAGNVKGEGERGRGKWVRW
ncbi:hypothetical protein E2C01_071796 [Portunus trituberculatus]|uniref:Uncharacterized protein n=1 Tax=Portunus trituberculatus TaxID=210409 RepID=A0A5B7I9D8_PORTR|nr:hypothetical protein [Portunus trituberculatus]